MDDGDDYVLPDETKRERQLRLVEDHGLIEDTGKWGEIVEDGIQPDGTVDEDAIVVRNPEVSTVGKRLSATEKQVAAMKLKLQGASFPEIARVLDVHPNTARKYVTKGMEDSKQETAKELKHVQHARYERLLQAVWQRAIQGDFAAVGKALDTMDRLDRLHGLTGSTTHTNTTERTRETLIIAEGDKGEYLAALKQQAERRELEPEFIDVDGEDAIDADASPVE